VYDVGAHVYICSNFQLSVCKYLQYDSRGFDTGLYPALPSLNYVLGASCLMLEITEF